MSKKLKFTCIWVLKCFHYNCCQRLMNSQLAFYGSKLRSDSKSCWYYSAVKRNKLARGIYTVLNPCKIRLKQACYMTQPLGLLKHLWIYGVQRSARPLLTFIFKTRPQVTSFAGVVNFNLLLAWKVIILRYMSNTYLYAKTATWTGDKFWICFQRAC